MKVAVTGCGPSGLLAAHAATIRGHDATIYSRPDRSETGGAQYLHAPIPYLCDYLQPDMYIRFVKIGTAEGYAQKVYGDENAEVSWTKFDEEEVPAWSMRAVYQRLWQRYSDFISPTEITPEKIEELVASHDMVINTIPLKSICLNPIEHSFRSQSIMLTRTAKIEARNVIVYNGQMSENWYRTSDIGGEQWTEYSTMAGGPPILGDRVRGFKPISNDCDCHPTVIRVGRFGAWERGILAHQAFRSALKHVSLAEARHAMQ